MGYIAIALAWCASDRPCQPRRIVSSAIPSNDRRSGVAGVIHQHRDIFIVATARSKIDLDMLLDVLIGVFDPRISRPQHPHRAPSPAPSARPPPARARSHPARMPPPEYRRSPGTPPVARIKAFTPSRRAFCPHPQRRGYACFHIVPPDRPPGAHS